MGIGICDRSKPDWREQGLALHDAVDLFRGKWRFCILMNLAPRPLRFTELQERIKISPKVLTKELQELEQNLLITRTVGKTKPVTVEYAVTEYARETSDLVHALIAFGMRHRKMIKGKLRPAFTNDREEIASGSRK